MGRKTGQITVLCYFLCTCEAYHGETLSMHRCDSCTLFPKMFSEVHIDVVWCGEGVMVWCGMGWRMVMWCGYYGVG